MKNRIYFIAIWWVLEYEIEETTIEFKAFKIIGLDEYIPENSTIEVNPEITGHIKWDECMEFSQNSHYCELERAEQTFGLFQEIYKLREITFGNL